MGVERVGAEPCADGSDVVVVNDVAPRGSAQVHYVRRTNSARLHHPDARPPGYLAALPRPGRGPYRASATTVREPSGGVHIVVERADASTTSLIDAATLAERIRTALGAESLGEALPEVPVRLVPDPEEDPR